MNTKHYENDRKLRDSFIKEVIGPLGELVYQGYMLNKDRSYLPEIHMVYSSGIIKIVNPYKGMDKIVTTKIARPGQITQVFHLPCFIGFDKNNKIVTANNNKYRPTKELMNKAKFYQQHGWNSDENLPPKNEWEFWRNELTNRNI
jgi:hypothetical protein